MQGGLWNVSCSYNKHLFTCIATTNHASALWELVLVSLTAFRWQYQVGCVWGRFLSYMTLSEVYNVSVTSLFSLYGSSTYMVRRIRSKVFFKRSDGPQMLTFTYSNYDTYGNSRRKNTTWGLMFTSQKFICKKWKCWLFSRSCWYCTFEFEWLLQNVEPYV